MDTPSTYQQKTQVMKSQLRWTESLPSAHLPNGGLNLIVMGQAAKTIMPVQINLLLVF